MQATGRPATPGGLAVPGLVRLARRRAGLSQRELAHQLGVSQSTVARIETGTLAPTVPIFQQILATAGLRLTVTDDDGAAAAPQPQLEELRDLGGRHYPAHTPLIVDPVHYPDWWEDRYDSVYPPATYHRPVTPGAGAEEREREPFYEPWPVGFRRRRKRKRTHGPKA